jgi:hypothetical protein
MKKSGTDRLTPRGITWPGVLFLGLLTVAGYLALGKDFAYGSAVGIAVGLINFKAIAFIVRRLTGPGGSFMVLYGIFGVLKFVLLAGIFFVLIYYKLFNVYGIVAGFSAVLLLIVIEGLLRASRPESNQLTAEEK